MKRIVLIGIAAALMLAAVPARAGETTATYTAFGRLIVNGPQQAGTIGFGGYSFTVAGGDPTSLKVVDQSGGSVAVMICQEAGAAETAPGACQDGGPGQVEGDDRVQKICSNGADQPLNAAFSSGTQTVAVFVYVADVTQRGTMCTGTGTTGTMTLKF